MKHGTRTAYNHHKCRCELCKQAHREYGEQYRQQNKDGLSTRERDYWRENKDKKSAKDARYREKHRDNIRAKKAADYQRDKDSVIARVHTHFEANRDEVLARNRQWKQDNRPKVREINARRRARKLEAFIEDVDPRVVYERDEGRCGICAKAVFDFYFDVDHIIPLARGGEHSYANVQLAHPECNLRKATN